MNRYQLDAYTALDEVKRRFVAYLRSAFRFRDPTLDEQVHRTIAELGLLAPTVVEATFPYEEPKDAPRTLRELTDAGLLHADLPRLLALAEGDAGWPEDRPLYTHQVKAVRSYREGKSLVVSSGTGSGKTEAFLFPAIDTVLRDKDLSRPGVRVLVVYPLNALVNNQMDRLRAILGHHPTIRFALYTRRLAQTQREAERKLARAGRPRYPAEVISREALRAAPPHILITNFSMLEYALVRPADAPIFSPSFARPKLVVLDEAHVYAGAMAAEITLLLRRAWLRWGMPNSSDVQGIVTSATMHQGIPDGLERLREFATKLLSKKPGEVVDISGGRVLPEHATPTVSGAIPAAAAVTVLSTDFPTLAVRVERGADGEEKRVTVFDESAASRELARAAAAALRPGVPIASETPAARLLWEALEPLGWVRSLRARLHRERAVRVDAVAAELFTEGTAEAKRIATYKVLGLLALARASATGLPLLPVRLHSFARGPHGIFACISASCDHPSVPGRLGALYTDPVERCTCGAPTCELRVCEACGQSFLTAEEGEDDEGLAALQPLGAKAVNLYVAGTAWDDGTSIEGGEDVHVFVSGEGSGRIAPVGDGQRLRRFPGGRLVGPTRQLVEVACPRCETKLPGGGIVRRIESGTDAALQVIIDGLYPELPEHKDAATRTLRGGGRRALLFADNRQIAAALAAKVEESHDLLLSRVILVESLKAASEQATSPEIDRLQAELGKLMATKGSKQERDRVIEQLDAAFQRGSPADVDFRRLVREVAAHQRLPELSCYDVDRLEALASMIVARELARRPARGGNLEASGLVGIDYALSLPKPTHPDVASAFTSEAWTSLIEVILDISRTAGIVALPDIGEPYDRYVLKARHNKLLVKDALRGAPDDEEEEAEGGKIVALVPGPTSTGRRVEYVGKVLARMNVPPTVVPRLVLSQVWESLEAASRADTSCMKLDDTGRAVGLRLPMQRLRFRCAEGAQAWRCPVCRTLWLRQVANACPTAQCGGLLSPTEGADLDPRDRLVALAHSKDVLLGMSTQEHTAQIGTDDLEMFEQQFKAGELNILVCSTTMELGIDIGGLSATVLTNVPPGPSNYLQRAGRAGRRAEGTSLVLTFARPRPFDQAAFEEPDRPFNDRIVPPRVQLDSRRIVQRHGNALLLAHFFRHYHAQADAKDPMASLRSVGEFCDKALSAVLGGSPELAKLVRDTSVIATEATLSEAFVAWLDLPVEARGEASSALEQLIAGTVLEVDGAETIAQRGAYHMRRITENVRQQLVLLRQERAEETEKPVELRDEGRVKALTLQEEDLLGEKLLGYLAEEQFLPRYGFPIQVVQLHDSYRYPKQGERGRRDDESGLRLARDIALALNEYAPGAEVVAQKHVHRSSGLVKHWTGADAPGVFSTRYVAVCNECGRFQHARTLGEVKNPCPTCRQGTPRSIRVILPKLGFAVNWGTPPRRWTSGMKPPLRPVTESAYAAREGESVLEVSPALALAYDEEGQILVRTEGQLDPNELPGADMRGAGAPRAGFGYAICQKCGRAEPEGQPSPDDDKKADRLPKPLVSHYRLRGSQKCDATTQYWRHMALAGAVRTETLNVQLRGPLEFPQGVEGRRLATTWMVALQLSAGQVLGIDSRQVGGLLVPRSATAGVVNDVLLYDQIAGGAGHCRALLDRWTELLDAAYERLACANPRCTNGCHRCLIAFETQRYEDMLRRRALRAFLDSHWAVLKEQPTRDGMAVGALFRGGAEIREALERCSGGTVTVFAPAIGADALDDEAWLPILLGHAERRGRVRLVVERLPDPNADSERFVAARLHLALATGRLELLAPKKGTGFFAWAVTTTDPARAFFIEKADPESLGPSWLQGSSVYEAMTEATRHTVMDRVDAALVGCRSVALDDLKPEPPPVSTVVHTIRAGEPGARATFDYWFRREDGTSVFSERLAELSIDDPYLATEWQLRLLRELVELARRAGCASIRVQTYAPRDEGRGYGMHRTVTEDEQRRSIAETIGNPSWKPAPPPARNVERMHKRVVRGKRASGDRFEVLLERGLDFIIEAGRGNRSTRESYIVVRDPL
jgi:ATP-dependent helicase YprA (DUF1998 family)